MNKADLRKCMLQSRTEISEEERKIQNESITQKVVHHPAFQQAHTLFCYHSTPQEIDTTFIIVRGLALGKKICLPRVVGKGRMQAYQIRDMSDLKPGEYGILEPAEDALLIDPDEIDLCIIPCLAADMLGYRLGYGGGYYDRFLPYTNAKKMVLCAEERIIPHIPSTQYDVACDIIITESREIVIHEE